jgi:hypothetical protein
MSMEEPCCVDRTDYFNNLDDEQKNAHRHFFMNSSGKKEMVSIEKRL